MADEIKNPQAPKPAAPAKKGMSLKEYMALKEKEEKKKNTKMNPVLRIVLLSPLILIFCFGLFYVPYSVYVIMTSPDVDESKKELSAYEKIMRKSSAETE